LILSTLFKFSPVLATSRPLLLYSRSVSPTVTSVETAARRQLWLRKFVNHSDHNRGHPTDINTWIGNMPCCAEAGSRWHLYVMSYMGRTQHQELSRMTNKEIEAMSYVFLLGTFLIIRTASKHFCIQRKRKVMFYVPLFFYLLKKWFTAFHSPTQASLPYIATVSSDWSTNSMAFLQSRSISLVDMYIDNTEPSENVGQIHFSLEYDFQNTTLILRILTMLVDFFYIILDNFQIHYYRKLLWKKSYIK
ncbi:hypothetical protein L9F63_015769, partial [Diploptera punctata]